MPSFPPSTPHPPSHHHSPHMVPDISSLPPSLPQFLLAHGAPIDDVDVAQRTALQWAIQYGRREVIKCLVGHGAKVGHQDANRATVRRKEGGREGGKEGEI